MDTPALGSNEFSRLVAGEYLSFFDFSGPDSRLSAQVSVAGLGGAHRRYIWILLPALVWTCRAALGKPLELPLGGCGEGPMRGAQCRDSPSAGLMGTTAKVRKVECRGDPSGET